MDEDRIVLNAAIPAEAPKSAYKDEELPLPAGAASITPFKHKRPTKLGVTDFNQWYTSSCVFHAFLTALEYMGIITKETLKSQLRAYRKRINYPNEGSIGYDAWDQIRSGVSPLADFPTPEKMRESAANAMKLVMGDPVLKDKFNYFDITDYSRIATYVASGKAVPIFIYATEDEWEKEYVDIEDDNLQIQNAQVRHAITIMPEGDFTEDGVQRFAVHDSAKFGKRGLRYLSLEFVLKRCYYAARIESKADPIVVEPPVVDRIPDVKCQLNDRGENVLALQRFLYDQGKLNAEYITGFYGALTAKAVLWYQLENWQKFTSKIPEILDWKGEYWGDQSIATLNK